MPVPTPVPTPPPDPGPIDVPDMVTPDGSPGCSNVPDASGLASSSTDGSVATASTAGADGAVIGDGFRTRNVTRSTPALSARRIGADCRLPPPPPPPPATGNAGARNTSRMGGSGA